MKRILAAAALGLTACALAWAGVEPSRHDKFGMEITFPDKWIVGVGEEPTLLLARSVDKESLSNCVAIGERIPGTRGLTQDQINQGLVAPFGEDFWRRIYAASGLDATVKSHGARSHKSGLTIQVAEFDLGKAGGAPNARMTIHQAIFVRPGQTVTLACGARLTAYAKHRKTLAAVIDSVRFFAPPAPVAAMDDAVAVPVKDGAISPADAQASSSAAARAGVSLLDLTQ